MLTLKLLSLQTVITVYRTDMMPIHEMAMRRRVTVKKPQYLPVRLYLARTHTANEEG